MLDNKEYDDFPVTIRVKELKREIDKVSKIAQSRLVLCESSSRVSASERTEADLACAKSLQYLDASSNSLRSSMPENILQLLYKRSRIQNLSLTDTCSIIIDDSGDRPAKSKTHLAKTAEEICLKPRAVNIPSKTSTGLTCHAAITSQLMKKN